jgi:nuclear pore complex protein Nup155
MGLFEEIGWAWITIDHRLFLWDYNGSEQFVMFDDQDQVIISVALVKPRPGTRLLLFLYI